MRKIKFKLKKLPNCCGVGELGRIDYPLYIDDDDDGYGVSELWSQHIYTEEIKRITDGIDNKFPLCICTITDQSKPHFKKLRFALVKCGWKLVDKVPSKYGMGYYNIYLFKRKFTE